MANYTNAAVLNPVTGLQMQKRALEAGVLATGCQGIDDCLKGGFRASAGITEVSGKSSSGKTQLCLQLAINCQKSIERGGLGGGALYVFCEGTFPVKRLQELAAAQPATLGIDGDQKTAKDITDRIFVQHADDCEQLWNLLSGSRLTSMLQTGAVKLVVIDSITSIIRGEFSTSRRDLSDRSDILFSFSGRMKRLASTFNCLFVVINQVSGVFPPAPGAPRASCMGTSFLPNGQESTFDSFLAPLKVTPSLGIAWSTCVTTRVLLQRLVDADKTTYTNGTIADCTNTHMKRTARGNKGTSRGTVTEFSPVPRELRVLLSPYIAHNASCRFFVTRNGLQDKL
jgi:DNA-repair protein XRCC3